MELRDAIRTTGAVRSFTDDPVNDAVVHAILDDYRDSLEPRRSRRWCQRMWPGSHVG
jgi:hypothetical protein